MNRRMTWMAAIVLAMAGALVYTDGVQATAPSGFVGTTLALGRFGDIDAANHLLPPDFWKTFNKNAIWLSFQKTKGQSDLYVQSNVWSPGGTTGWHSHPGHSLIIVTTGAVTAYEGDDPSCTPRVYTQGMGLVDPGGDHVHVLRNEGLVEARTITVQLIPAGAMRRIDAAAPSPSACQF